MIDYTYANLYYESSINKQLNIEAEDGAVITNTNIYQESMSLSESLCSEGSLTFGCCEASVFKIKIANQFSSLYGQRLTVTETLDGNTDEPFQFGVYRVVEDTPTADRIYRNITAYDAMYDIINADATAVAEWYNAVLPNEDSTVTMKEFRTSFLELFGIEQEDATLVNDNMTVEKTISVNTLSGKTVICAICEINGCFGHIGRDGKFQYIYLEPISESEAVDIGHSNYKSCDYEDYTTSVIDKLQIRQEEDDVGCTYGDGDNCYIIEGNFLAYGKGSSELAEIAANIYTKIAGISYRPTSGIVAIGNPCIEVGDGIFLSTKYQDIATYVLQRTLSGIQALEDTYEASGTETCENSGNSLESTITQLKGKTNVLTRTVEETKSQISDVEEGLTNTIAQTADSLKSEISKVSDSVSTLESAAITGSVTEYYKSTSATELSGGEWSETSPEWEDGTYIWMRTTVTYGTDESSVVKVTTDPVCITGNTGAQGEQGIQGLQGIQGEQGEQGIQGETGADGKTSYFHIKYSDIENPTTADEMTETPSDYIGTYVDYTEDDSTDPADYTWMKWVGEDGAQGIQGVKGDDGTTYYLHIAYANSEDGSADFSTSDSTGKSYIGQYTDTEIDDSADYTKYSWTKIKGDTGESGVSVVSVTAYYAVSESSSYYPSFADDETSSVLDTMILGSAVLGNSSEWSEAMPEVEDNEYLWIAFLVTYSNGTSQWTEPCLLTDESTREAITILQEQNSAFEQTLNSFEFTLSSLDSVVTANYEYTETRMSEFEVTLNGLSATASETLEQVGTLQTEAVTGTVTEYYKSVSPTECSGGTWTEDTVEWEEGYYIWVRTTVSYGVGEQATTQTSAPVCITGNTGATGGSGNDGASVSISSTEITYRASTSGTDTPTSGWTTEVPEVEQGQYLWTKTVVNYTLTASDGTTSTKTTTSYSVAYIGSDGEQGEKGEKGDTGDAGRGIVSTEVYYAVTDTGGYCPSFGDDGTTSTLGTSVLGSMILGNSGTWTEEIPEVSDGQYLWTLTIFTYSDNTTDRIYSVAKSGDTGSQGEQGIQGLQGLQGDQGEQGIQGETGADGKTSYFHIKYSESENPTSASDMSETPSTYIGTYVDYTETDSTDPSDYTWVRWIGEDGAQGIAGTNGIDGKTYYLHIAYANSEDGKTDFSVDDSTDKSYIGQYTDTTEDDSTDYTKYSWTKIKGEDGSDGVGIQSIKNYYLATSKSSGVDVSTSGWTETVQSVSADKKYLWNYETVTLTDGNTDISTPCIIGAYGDTGATGASGSNGEDGVSIESVQEYYAVSTSNSSAPTAWSTSVATMSATNKYLWNYEVITYSDGSTSETAKRVIGVYGDTGAQGEQGEKGDTGDSGVGISSITEYYAVSSSNSSAPASWSTSVQTMTTADKYLWNYEVIKYTDGTTTQTAYRVIGVYGNTGATGATGADGVGISDVTNYYLRSTASSGVTTSTSGWTESIQAITTTYKYLWNYEVITYTDGSTYTSTPCVIGVYGDTGATGAAGTDGASVEIQSTKVTYQATSSGTETPSGTWSESVPEMEAGQYLWTKTEVTYLLTASDGTTSTETTTSYSVSYIGVDGEKGDTGDAGVSVESVTIYYALSESSTYAPSHGDDGATTILGTMVLGTAVLGNSGKWYTEAPEVGETEYLWSCFLITYSNGVTSWTEPCCLTDDSTRNLVSTLSDRVYEFEASLDGFLYSLNSLEENIYTNYSTTQELEVLMNAKIEDSEASITEGISATYATIKYADEVADAAEAAANSATDTKLAAYTTTTDMNTVINQAVSESEASIMETVSATYVTTDTLKGYSTTTDMQNTITQYIGENNTNYVDVKVSSVEETVNDTIKTYKVYYAISDSASYYPTHGDDGTTSILGTDTLGSMILGNSGEWTETQPTAEDGEYIWVSYYIEYVDGTTEWTEPTLITDAAAWNNIRSLNEQTAEILVSLSSISLSVTQAITTAASYTDKTVSASLVLEIATDSGGNPYGKISSNADYIEFTCGEFVINGDNGGQFTFDANGNATFSGELKAASGTFSGELRAATGTFSGDLNAAGGTFTGTLSGVDGDFSGTVTATYLTANSGGQIAGWTITSDRIQYSGTDPGTGDSMWIFMSSNAYSSEYGEPHNPVFGVQYGGDWTFYVRSNGELYAKSGTFCGALNGATGTFTGALSGGSINIGNGTFVVDSSGNMTATSGLFSGDVVASSLTALKEYYIHSDAGTKYLAMSAFDEGDFGSGLIIGDGFQSVHTNGHLVAGGDIYALEDGTGTVCCATVSCEKIECGGSLCISDGTNIAYINGAAQKIEFKAPGEENYGVALWVDNRVTKLTFSPSDDINIYYDADYDVYVSTPHVALGTAAHPWASLRCTGAIYCGAGGTVVTHTAGAAVGSSTSPYLPVYISSTGVATACYIQCLYENGTTTAGVLCGTDAFRVSTSAGSGGLSLGNSSYKWGTIYSTSSSISTSDERVKTDIVDVDEVYENLFMKLRGVNYRYKNFTDEDNHDRIHCGLIAQEVETAMTEVGLSAMEFATLCYDDDLEEGCRPDGRTDEYGIAYDELHGLEIHMIQKNVNAIDELKSQIADLQAQLAELQASV